MFQIALILHLAALVAGGSNSVVMPIVEGRLPGASQAERQALFALANTLSKVGKVAMVILLVTGPVMVWARYGGLADLSVWFWIKMALIVVMLFGIIAGGIAFKRYQSGDAGGLARAGMFGKVTGVAAIGVVVAAVLAFN